MADDGLRQCFRQYLPQFDWNTIEIWLASNGVPDLNGCYQGTEVWVEMKACEHWRVKVRPAQIGWAERRLEHGGRVFCAVRRAHDELWLYQGAALRLLKSERLDEVSPLGCWHGGPARWDWKKVAQWLLQNNY